MIPYSLHWSAKPAATLCSGTYDIGPNGHDNRYPSFISINPRAELLDFDMSGRLGLTVGEIRRGGINIHSSLGARLDLSEEEEDQVAALIS